MPLALLPTRAIVSPNLTTPFEATGGTEPYVYSVDPGGAGGSIDSNGLYTAPGSFGNDVIRVVDDDLNEATSTVAILSPLEIFCDILQTEMDLDEGRVYLWDQKINSPTDFGLFIAVGVLAVKPFGVKSEINPATGEETQSANFQSDLSVDVISRDTSALYRKEEIILALRSLYCEQQQALNSMRVFPLAPRFVNLSGMDGAAIPYRFSYTVRIQYMINKTKVSPYFDQFNLSPPLDDQFEG